MKRYVHCTTLCNVGPHTLCKALFTLNVSASSGYTPENQTNLISTRRDATHLRDATPRGAFGVNAYYLQQYSLIWRVDARRHARCERGLSTEVNVIMWSALRWTSLPQREGQ